MCTVNVVQYELYSKKMYRKYLETGKVIYPKKSKKGNSTTATASTYMNKYSRAKNKKANRER